jgi:hypothetical protein
MNRRLCPTKFDFHQADLLTESAARLSVVPNMRPPLCPGPCAHRTKHRYMPPDEPRRQVEIVQFGSQ